MVQRPLFSSSSRSWWFVLRRGAQAALLPRNRRTTARHRHACHGASCAALIVIATHLVVLLLWWSAAFMKEHYKRWYSMVSRSVRLIRARASSAIQATRLPQRLPPNHCAVLAPSSVGDHDSISTPS